MPQGALAEHSIAEVKPKSTELSILPHTLDESGCSNGRDFTEFLIARQVTLEMLRAVHSGNDVFYLTFLL